MDVTQIWAETLPMVRHGEKLYLDAPEAAIAISEQSGALEEDEREGIVRTYLDKLLPEEWDRMNLFERRNFLNGSCEFGAEQRIGVNRRTLVCNMAIWCECFGKEASQMKKADSYEIASILKRISGWEKYTGTKDGSFHFSLYGKQRSLQRTEQFKK